jgi:uncharacterized protein YkwD
MSITRRAFLFVGAGATLSACASIGITTNVPVGHTTPQQLSPDTILAAINEARRINGNHRPMAYSMALETAARSQANLMAQKDSLAHNLGVTLRERVRAAGYIGAVGENIAGGQTSLQQAIEGWLNSPGHRATLLSDRFVEFGLAQAHTATSVKSRYGNYWCFIAGGPVSAWLGGTGVPPEPSDSLTVDGGVNLSIGVSG